MEFFKYVEGSLEHLLKEFLDELIDASQETKRKNVYTIYTKGFLEELFREPLMGSNERIFEATHGETGEPSGSFHMFFLIHKNAY